jgi:hypothetical protein
MTWFKVDDSFYDHPKVFDAPDCALALWTRAGAWSARNLTDGFVPAGMPARFCDDPERAVKELLNRGLWRRTKGGYLFHDWSVYQPTKEEVIAGRDEMSSGGALGNHRRWHVKKGKSDPKCRYCADSVNKPETQNRIGSASGSALNSHPEKTPPGRSNRGDQGKQNRVPHRVPDRVPDGIPESPPNPPARPGQSLGGALRDPLTPGARDAPPPSKCPDHEHLDEPPPCGRCADARRARTRWELADAERLRKAPKCRRHRGQLADNCALCRSEALASEEDS